MNAASAALMISNIPFPTPVGAVRIGKVDGNFVVNPTEEQQLTADLDLVVAGTDEAILMVEAGANEITEAEMLDALDIAHGEIKKLCAAQLELAAKVFRPSSRSPRRRWTRTSTPRSRPRTARRWTRRPASRTSSRARTPPRRSRSRCSTAYSGDPEADTYAEYRGKAQLAFKKLEKNIIRQRIAVDKKRPDGRSENEIRPISIDVGILPRTHGTASSRAVRRRCSRWSRSARRASR